MHYYEVAPNKLIRSDSGVFTYASEAALTRGQLVTIPVGRQTLVGLVMNEVKRPTYATKPITNVLAISPLPESLVQLCVWLHEYYATHLALVLQTLLPRGLTTTRRPHQTTTHQSSRDRTKNVFTKDQTRAIDDIEAMGTGTALLHGVTGSGKTLAYIELARRTLARGRSVIILVPEIALTTQLVDEFAQHFPDIILTHSRQTDAERHRAWLEALQADSPRVVIGPRSALFLPLKDVGLVVIDEAHEPSFKQEKSPRYSALRVASKLMQLTHGKVIMGSATPPVSEYFLIEKSGQPIITMPSPARPGAVKPHIELVDMTKRTHFKHHRFLSDTLLSHLEDTFAAGEQALIYHNRRGSASTTLCENCGWSAGCPRCYVPLTLHADQHQLLCHLCGYQAPVPTSCPSCGHADIIHKGIGTKLIESELVKLFPHIATMRFDGDNDKDTVDRHYAKLYDGSVQLIIGTQTIAKGLDLPHLRTVGIVQADNGLVLPDYTASERTFQLLAQVVGRVGRSHHPTSVIVQSYQPAHPAVVDGIAQNYGDFYARTLGGRKAGYFPPFCYLMKLVCIYKTEAAAIRNAKNLASQLRQMISPDVQILGPTPAFYERQHDTYRWQLIVKSPRRADLLALIEQIPTTHWQFELDPTSLL